MSRFSASASAFDNDDGSASGMTRAQHDAMISAERRAAVVLIRSLQNYEDLEDLEGLEEGRITSKKHRTNIEITPEQVVITPEKVQKILNYLIAGGKLAIAIMVARELGVTPNGVIDAALYLVTSIADTGVILLTNGGATLGNAGSMCIEIAVDASSEAGHAAAYTVSTLAQYFTIGNLGIALDVAVGTVQGVIVNTVHSILRQYVANNRRLCEDISYTFSNVIRGITNGKSALKEFQAKNLLLYTPSSLTRDAIPQPSAFINTADTCESGKFTTKNLDVFERLVDLASAEKLRLNAFKSKRSLVRITRAQRKPRRASSTYKVNAPSISKMQPMSEDTLNERIQELNELIQERKRLIFTKVLTGISLIRISANSRELNDEINKLIEQDEILNDLKKKLDDLTVILGRKRSRLPAILSLRQPSNPYQTASQETESRHKNSSRIYSSSQPGGGIRRTKRRNTYRKSYKKRTPKRRPRRKTHRLSKRNRRRTRK